MSFSDHIPQKLLDEGVYLRQFIDVLDKTGEEKSSFVFKGVKGIGNHKIIFDTEYLRKLISDISSLPIPDDISLASLNYLANTIVQFTRGSSDYEGIDRVLENLTGENVSFVNLDLAYPQQCLCFDELDPNRCSSTLPDGADLVVAANNPRHFLFPFDDTNGFSEYYRDIHIQITGYSAMAQSKKDFITRVINFFIFTNDSIKVTIISV